MRPLFDSEVIFGIHEPGGEQHMLEAGRPGWIVFTEQIGADPNDRSGKDFRDYSVQGLGILCRLNNGYQPAGTIPHSSRYEDFARRCANYVAASQGCKIWIVGNEMNYWVERPGAQARALLPATRGETSPEAEAALLRALPDRFNALYPDRVSTRATGAGEVITPEMYARCYRLCRDAIHRVPGHGDDQVLVGAVAPWNTNTTYPDNPGGDWVQYFQDILKLLGPDGCDGITLHTYTHSADPAEVNDDRRMDPPFQHRRYNFRTYQDFMAAVPQNMRHLPVYITETDQDVAWANVNRGWVQRAYGEIDSWNRQPGNQQMRALVLYRWPQVGGDRWYITGKAGVIEDFRQALRNDYRWRAAAAPAPPAAAPYKVGDTVYVRSIVNLRRSPGFVGKPADDVAAQLAYGARSTVVEGPRTVDNLVWWRLRAAAVGDETATGWVAQADSTGKPLLGRFPPPAPATELRSGETVYTLDATNLRRTPGYVGKLESDVLTAVPYNSRGVVLFGPQQVDGLTWWQIDFALEGGRRNGWVAMTAPGGLPLLSKSSPEAGPGTTPEPEPVGKFRLGSVIHAAAYLNVRRSPGYVNKAADDVVGEIAYGKQVAILGGPQPADGLTWWRIRRTADGLTVEGWVAESTPDGMALLSEEAPPPLPAGPPSQPSTPAGTFKIGDLVCNINPAPVNLRRTPGYVNKPADDVLAEVPGKATMTVVNGPIPANGLTWWQVQANVAGARREGWTAEVAPNGVRLLAPANLAYAIVLSKPFEGSHRITQYWGENPNLYSRFTYDGVPLRGHNGIDFGTPVGTRLLAVDAGRVIRTDYEPGGFGHFVLLEHRWGQSVYAHMDRVSVRWNDTVEREQALGLSGNTGNSTGPHLHFSIRIDPYNRGDGWGGYSDPLPFMDLAALGVMESYAVGVQAVLQLPDDAVPPGAMVEVPGRRRP